MFSLNATSGNDKEYKLKVARLNVSKEKFGSVEC